ncbi:MAG: hypothetical protein ABI432_03865 [Flavobacteriales bacterium]
MRQLFQASSKVDYADATWAACNTDSAYFRSDTIRLVQGTGGYSTYCCEFVRWSFRNGVRFNLTKGHYCQEPPMEELRFKNREFAARVVDGAGELFIRIGHGEEIVDEFKVESVVIENTWLPVEHRTTITMVRIKN